VRLVGRMQDEAAERGVSLNVERLLGADPELAERSRGAFAAAAAAAAAAGLEISLPESVPRSARECEFVEGGSAFVSREGGVHPCYFLWHRYDCFAGGWEKRVAPRSFGSLGERGILEIWNDPAFASFRANVLRYEYPFCLNCNLALCDYVQLPDFEQDCHMNAEPCAACLWCMGLFRCMY
jgi:MoaA/NifB/PqqE/SkfB family radical SAM enzyme